MGVIYNGRYVIPSLISRSLVWRTMGLVTYWLNLSMHLLSEDKELRGVDLTSIGQMFLRDVTVDLLTRKSISMVLAAFSLRSDKPTNFTFPCVMHISLCTFPAFYFYLFFTFPAAKLVLFLNYANIYPYFCTNLH